jgi:predicted DNA-binding protein
MGENEVVQVAARIPIELHRRFKAECARRGLVMSQVLQGRIEDWLEEVEAQSNSTEGGRRDKSEMGL